MSNWVEEFNEFQGGVTPGGGMKSNYAPMKQSRTEKIKAELQLLEWHKLANDAALKAALMQTKNVRETTPEANESTNDINTKRIRQIVTNEQTKPLEVTRDFVLKYEQKEIKNSERLTEQVERHISTLRSIREKLESKLELKERINDYREWKKGFVDKKYAVLGGKTLSTFQAQKHPSEPVTQSIDKTVKNASKDLATVLDSLNKLAQLETRITDLEKNNVYEKMRDAEERKAFDQQEKTALEFTKRRATDSKTGPNRAVYAIRQKKVPLHQGATIRGVAKKGKSGGTFLTDVGDTDTDDRRDAILRERQRKIAQASSGQKNVRERVKSKKERVLMDINSHKKHEIALAELAKRRSQQAERMKTKRKEVIEGKGASGTRKYKNKHLQDFQQIKKEHRDKKDHRRAEAAEKRGVANTIGSNTMPDIRKVERNRQPATRTAGTVTRRTGGNGKSVPVRRSGTGPEVDSDDNQMPPIVGSGVGGARKLRQQRAMGKR